jgi:hypothetical protein
MNAYSLYATATCHLPLPFAIATVATARAGKGIKAKTLFHNKKLTLRFGFREWVGSGVLLLPTPDPSELGSGGVDSAEHMVLVVEGGRGAVVLMAPGSGPGTNW